MLGTSLVTACSRSIPIDPPVPPTTIVVRPGSGSLVEGAHARADRQAAPEYVRFDGGDGGAPAGYVGRSGTSLMLHGAPFHFSGVNIYQANSVRNCSYTMGTGPALDESLTAIGSGPNRVFRSWFFQSLATVGEKLDWSVFDHTLSVATAHGYRVIPTLTNQWGSCESQPQSVYKTLAWYQGGYRSSDGATPLSFRDYASQVVAHYRDNPAILSWQLVNEAEAADRRGGACQEAKAAQALRAFADDVGGLVKSIDHNHLVSLGTTGSGQCGIRGGDYQVVSDSAANDWCEYHDYGHPGEPLPAALLADIEACTQIARPLVVGETGITTAEAGDQAHRALQFDAKLKAQFAAGVAGELVWAWDLNGSSATSYQDGPGDPTIGVVMRYAESHSEETKCATPLPWATYGTATVRVSVRRAGTYRVWSRVRAGAGKASYDLQVDEGCPVAVTAGPTARRDTWTWTSGRDGDAATTTTLDLPAGQHTVSLVGTARGAAVDSVIFALDAKCVPAGAGDNCVDISPFKSRGLGAAVGGGGSTEAGKPNIKAP